MKIEIGMKTPDCVEDAIKRAISDPDEIQRVTKMAENWFQYGECVTLELDTDNDTCVVLRR